MAEGDGLSLADLVNAISTAGSDVASARPIGVPAGYAPPQPVFAGPPAPPGIPNTGYGVVPGARPAPYMDGDDWRPASQPPEVIAGIQQRLANAGLLTGEYRIGVWDERTRVSYRSLLEYANGIGVDDGTALDRYASTQQGVAEVETPRAPLVARVSNPADLRRGLRDEFRESVGSGAAADARMDEMVKGYQGQEVAAQRAAYDAQATGGTVTAPPDFATFAEAEARKADPVAFDAYKVLDKVSVLHETFGGQS